MNSYDAKCIVCQQTIFWQECPTGGWWAHGTHPKDGHDAQSRWNPTETMDYYGNWVTQ